jgi:MoxR-like ATPase
MRIFGILLILAVFLSPAPDAVAQSENDGRDATGGAQTLEDILARQRGENVAPRTRDDAAGHAAEIADQLGVLGGDSDSDIWQALRYGQARTLNRDEPVRLALLSALAGEHILLIGLPGTAKSVMARRLHQAFRDSRYFERLLTRFSVPEELFGPLSIKALEDDRYERQTEKYLPTASVAFIDEIFKANSAILNALLTLLNEREFDNGSERFKTPLVSVVAASNELPDAGELDALYDRFLLRYEVQPVGEAHFTDLLLLDEQPCVVDPAQTISADELAEIQQGAAAVRLSDEVIRLLQALREFLQAEGIYVSDRRWRKAVKLLKISAHTNDKPAVSIWDCALLQHCLWNQPEQRALISRWYQRHIGVGSGFNAERLNKLLAVWEAALQKDTSSQTQLRNSRNEPLYLDENNHQTTVRRVRRLRERDGQPLYLAPPDQADRTNDNQGYTAEALREQFFDDVYGQCHIDGEWQTVERYLANSANRLVDYVENPPAMAPTLHEQAFITSRVNETGSLLDEIRQLRDRMQAQLATLDDGGGHLWVDDGFIADSRRHLEENIAEVGDVITRLEEIHHRYQRLPVRETTSVR